MIDYAISTAFQGVEAGPFQQGYLDVLTFRFENLLYYSFVTLTTLGYGDIIPLFPGAKFLSIIEAITGQLYIATVIARLLGLYLSHKTRAE
ncbi:potassium channel family protein [Simkania sp.]|uniref:potassium channel family protein n=1 Tax=Simkania sp. TaxID=34094 RepID=UPI003B51ADC5